MAVVQDAPRVGPRSYSRRMEGAGYFLRAKNLSVCEAMEMAAAEKTIMASNVGNVVVTVKLDDSLRHRVIVLLEKCKQDHYNERSGLSSCPAPQGTCDCGADVLNSEIDAMIAELRKVPKSSGIEYL